jgi:hypothetical protein
MASRAQKQAARLEKQRKAAARAQKRKKLVAQAKVRAAASAERVAEPGRPCCGLCGATKNLTRTECCGEWICDDEDQYVLFSYARNSCSRNHRRYTLCGSHFDEGHSGRWQDCPKCRQQMEPEMYVYYGTNEYNFEVLQNPPEYQPTHCASCGRVIVLADGGYSYSAQGYLCGHCTAAKHPGLTD